ncbi:hypothetical protein GPECTOR_47g325 [Gonium pectorale]|uniref:Protein kinase domain-containing protein n=1 Tax=Gonium pectorale TaxID=33097 RepID=A0A150G9M4_GONPE|nr:hypothetical protein GPECTOR_47g325 [Gonium pectorale]|eukprot:KXZ46050.1 hypothetical protein GPECTOR_47g325 [Gonium pectorale]
MGLVHATGQEIAVKQLRLTADPSRAERVRELERMLMELSRLQHDNLVRLLSAERTAEHLNILLEYISGGSLAGKLAQFGPLREETIRLYAKQMLRGLQYLHGHGIAHRNIKASNVLVDTNGVLKLADFGISRQLEGLGLAAAAASQPVPAPEVVSRQEGNGCAADIWALALIVIEMVIGQPPQLPPDPTASAALQVLPPSLSGPARDFLAICLRPNPSDRPSAAKLQSHAWMRGVAVPRVGPSAAADDEAAASLAAAAAAQPEQPLSRPRAPAPPPAASAAFAAYARSPPSPIKESSMEGYSRATSRSSRRTTASASGDASGAAGFNREARRVAAPAAAVVEVPAGPSASGPSGAETAQPNVFDSLCFNPVEEPTWVPTPVPAQMVPDFLRQPAAVPARSRYNSSSASPGGNASPAPTAAGDADVDTGIHDADVDADVGDDVDPGLDAEAADGGPWGSSSDGASSEGGAGRDGSRPAEAAEGCSGSAHSRAPAPPAATQALAAAASCPAEVEAESLGSLGRRAGLLAPRCGAATVGAAATCGAAVGGAKGRRTGAGGVCVPSRPRLAGIFAMAYEDDDPLTRARALVATDASAASAAGPKAGAHGVCSSAGQQQQPATASNMPRATTARRALEEAGVLAGGTFDPALAKRWRAELAAEQRAAAERGAGAGAGAAASERRPVRASAFPAVAAVTSGAVAGQ